MPRYFLWLGLAVCAFAQDASITVTVQRPLILPVEQATFVLNAAATGDETLDDVLAALGDLGLRPGDLLSVTVPPLLVLKGSSPVPFAPITYRFSLTVPAGELAATTAKIEGLKHRVSVISVTPGATDATRERVRNALYPEMIASARATAENQAAALGRRVMGVLTVREADEPRWISTGDFTSFAKSVPAAPETVGVTVQFQSR